MADTDRCEACQGPANRKQAFTHKKTREKRVIYFCCTRCANMLHKKLDKDYEAGIEHVCSNFS